MLCFGILESRKFIPFCQNIAAIDVLVVCIPKYLGTACLLKTLSFSACCLGNIHIGVGFALLVLQNEAMREPKNAEQAIVQVPLFCCM